MNRRDVTYVDIFAPTRNCPYYSVTPRESEGGWGTGSSPIYDPRNGHYDGRCTLTDADAIMLVRTEYPNATIVVRGEATYVTGYKNPERLRSEPNTKPELFVMHECADGKVDFVRYNGRGDGDLRGVPMTNLDEAYAQLRQRFGVGTYFQWGD